MQNLPNDKRKDVEQFLETEFSTSKTEILDVLLHSCQHGNIVGVRAEGLGAGMYLTAIEEIVLEDGDTPLIILKKFDVRGYIFPTYKIHLSEITAAHAFTSNFENPFLDKKNDDDTSLLNKMSA